MFKTLSIILLLVGVGTSFGSYGNEDFKHKFYHLYVRHNVPFYEYTIQSGSHQNFILKCRQNYAISRMIVTPPRPETLDPHGHPRAGVISDIRMTCSPLPSQIYLPSSTAFVERCRSTQFPVKLFTLGENFAAPFGPGRNATKAQLDFISKFAFRTCDAREDVYAGEHMAGIQRNLVNDKDLYSFSCCQIPQRVIESCFARLFPLPHVTGQILQIQAPPSCFIATMYRTPGYLSVLFCRYRIPTRYNTPLCKLKNPNPPEGVDPCLEEYIKKMTIKVETNKTETEDPEGLNEYVKQLEKYKKYYLLGETPDYS